MRFLQQFYSQTEVSQSNFKDSNHTIVKNNLRNIFPLHRQIMMDSTVIIDNGASTIKVGFAADDKPLAKVPTLVASECKNDPADEINFVDFSNPEGYSNYKDIIGSRDRYKLADCIIERGIVKDWDKLETLWNFIFKTELLKADLGECNLLMTEALFIPKTQRQTMAERLFEKFSFPHIAFSDSGMLPLYASGLNTGIVLECGESFAQTFPVWEGKLPDFFLTL